MSKGKTVSENHFAELEFHNEMYSHGRNHAFNEVISWVEDTFIANKLKSILNPTKSREVLSDSFSTGRGYGLYLALETLDKLVDDKSLAKRLAKKFNVCYPVEVITIPAR